MLRRAVELDPNCAEAYCSLGALAATIDRDWSASETYFRRALAVNPNNALALNWLSIITLVPQMRFEEAFDAVFAVPFKRLPPPEDLPGEVGREAPKVDALTQGIDLSAKK